MTKKELNKQIKDLRTNLKSISKLAALLVKRVNAIDRAIIDRKGKLSK